MSKMSKHTREPWIKGTRADIYGYVKPGSPVPIYCSGDILVARVLVSDTNDEQAEANAARIVACVNACEGIEDPCALADIVPMLKRHAEYLRGLEQFFHRHKNDCFADGAAGYRQELLGVIASAEGGRK
jgi:hypothetical protein